MPTIRLTVPPGDLSDQQKEAFIERMTDTVSQFYREEKDEDVREFVNVRIAETAETGYAIGGEVIG
ncbi:MAG: 4-oxalocrotonate tautomerase family protein [Salinibacter sp.]|uniref:4-oxalocrotonate tautomerase family protein n=1 Tax=Salinibacter sp. TaxID=2065818 RepID=UPI0035D44AD8